MKSSPFPVSLGLYLLPCLLLAACGKNQPPGGGVEAPQAASSFPDSIPPDQFSAVIDAHYRGLGFMERYEYAQAAQAFIDVHARAPGWSAGTINLAIALLNQGGDASQKAAQVGQAKVEQESLRNIERARILLDGVIARSPDQPYAHFARGVILRSQGDVVAAHQDFAKVVEIDPLDAHAWLEYGGTLTNPEQPGMPPERGQAPQLIRAYIKALEANPYLLPAMFKLQSAYTMAGDRQNAQRMLERFRNLNSKPPGDPASAGEVAATVYGEMGKYAQIIDPFQRPKPPIKPTPSPRFDLAEALKIDLPAGDRWATQADYGGAHATIGRARVRFGAGVASFDVNGDGQLDLYLTAAIVGPRGLRDALLVNRGGGRFEDQTESYGLPLDRAGIGVAAGDFDADFQVDLYLTGINDNRLFHNERARFQDVTQSAGVQVVGTISLTARWFDLDQDGDLDLYVTNHAPISELEQEFTGATSGRGVANSAFRNDGKPAEVGMRPSNTLAPIAAATPELPAQKGLSLAFSTNWAGAEALGAGTTRHSGFAALDIDDDRDFDYVVTADGVPPVVVVNDRGGQFHQAELKGWQPPGDVSGLLSIDVDRDGHADIVAPSSSGRVFAWRNATTRKGAITEFTGQSHPIDAVAWRNATAVDLDLDTWSDLVGLPVPGSSRGIEWAHNASTRFETHPLPLPPVGDEIRGFAGFTLANLVGDALPDLVLWREGEAPRVAQNRGNGSHWLAIDLAGRWKTSFDQMRTNSEGLGTRLSLEGQGLYAPVDFTTAESGPSQSTGPIVVGMGTLLTAPLLRVRWPDGVMQSELNVTGDKTLKLIELSRKTGSCPILFTWNGERFVCVGDFAGAAGLGFLEKPGEYHVPDRDESLLITAKQLRDQGGIFRMSVVEPMDEIAYLDHLALDVVDSPPGAKIALDERFAVGSSFPTGRLLSWTTEIPPITAVDHRDRDLMPLLRDADRRSVDDFARLNGRVGYTETHGMILDFGDQLSRLPPGTSPILCLTGWVEYPYSQTNYAAATAGVVAQPPILEQQGPHGNWEIIDAEMGHPAGLTRMMTVKLAGKLLPKSGCKLRIRTNLECYWDQAFVAAGDAQVLRQVRSTSLPVSSAQLGDRGYLREFSPDGLKPVLPDYHLVDPAPLARLRGSLTRQGDVTPLLKADDDQLCVMGPGDEVQLEFDGRGLPPLTAGWTRSYVLRSIAYCKDADPFTATSDSVGPLPWKGMAGFPFPPAGERPQDPNYSAYLRAYQTRPAGEP